ncbi:hypothetical protein Nocox_23160 [Nonomuraea coxensis DSM 45129]|uniref:DUF1023 domain-containing protein n=1 Tax=Nonomuraea coxensis DSM 45129 TaxID=1122611 RepID=A0ABX8U3B3_9ACTN|nr:alpha/beta hydrolase [Nonomuraea coxensis]QYC42235.1 hypothetical protein Nocox_23160 [Nonomuraea coxensis DSM 45129]
MIQSNLLRLRRALLSLSVATSVAAPVIGAARPAAVPAPVPASAAPLSELTARALTDRYATSRSDVLAAEDAAARHGDLRRAAALRAMAAPGRRFLSFDGREGGRVVEIFGDLAAAEHVAVLVPGADTHLEKYGLLHGGALRLHQTLGDGYAVVAWLGYRTPATLSLDTLTSDLADEGAAGLRDFVRRLAAAKGGGGVSLLCHSYGGVVCARAAPGLDVARILLTGSPGVGADNARALRTSATVWAGRASHDWISLVPHTRLHLFFVTLGLGADPVSPDFGARVFAAGDGGHSDYLTEGSLALHNIARIITGQDPLQADPGRSRPDTATSQAGRGPTLMRPAPVPQSPDDSRRERTHPGRGGQAISAPGRTHPSATESTVNGQKPLTRAVHPAETLGSGINRASTPGPALHSAGTPGQIAHSAGTPGPAVDAIRPLPKVGGSASRPLEVGGRA